MLQYLDFSHASTSRKWGHKRQGDGLEAPRNSMEFALEASHSYGVFQEDVPYSCNMRQYPKSGLSHSSNPVKKLIQEDISFRTNEGQKRPGVIARLMGMESPPLNATTESISRSEITPRPTMARRDNPSEITSAKHVSFVQHNNRDSTKQAPKQEIRAYGYGDERDVFGQTNKRSNEWSKPQPREHPQEEELQKFKKEFEAWQASRAWEQSRSFELESSLDDDDDDDDDSRCTDIVPYRYQHHHNGNGKAASHGTKHWRRSSKESSTSISGSRTFSLTTSADAAAACSTRLPLSRFYHEEERSSLSPTRIVILKPCPELSTDDIEESSLGSPELVKKENNMEAFLEEVKKRLKIELEGGVASDDKQADRRWAPAAGDIIPADPKQIARSIANQIRENVTRDMHPALVRSESTRSYRSDVPFDGQGQMDYIGRDARRQLSHRLKNVLRRDPPDAETPFSFSHRRRATSTSFDEEPRPKPTRHEVAPPPPPPRKGKARSKEEKKRAVESDVRSFRYGSNNTPTTTAQLDSEPVSPRNLMRSFSAPASGTTFVKLLSEEPRVLTGARLQRKQEGHGSSRPASSSEERKGRKDAFSIRGKVSNLRQNLGLRAKLFGKKFHASDEPFPDDLPPIGTLITAPSVLIHPGVLQENSTEVPPSPASWCSSPPDEMSRGGYPSPVSPLEASFSVHRSALRTETKDMASTASEPGILSEQVQTEEERAETSPVLDEQDDGDMEEADHPMKSFVRAVLVVAGMYGRRQNPGDAAMSECEAKPIPKWVLEEVVSSSSSSSSAPADGGAAAVDHRLLFDLVNEALPGAVRASTTLFGFDKCYAMAPRRAPGGKALLKALWKSMHVWLEPPSDRTTASSASVDVLIGRDLSVSPWHGAFREDADALTRDVEAEMLDELLHETVWDVLLNVGD